MGKTTTQKTEIPPMTEQERQFMDLLNGALIPSYLDSVGYSVSTDQIPFDQTDEGKNLYSAWQTAKQEYDQLSQTMSFAGGGDPHGLAFARKKMDEAQTAYDEAQTNYTPAYSYNVTEKDSPYLEAIKEKYGEGSTEYKEAKDKELDTTISQQSQLAEIQSKIIDQTMKFMNGDYEISDKQKEYIKESFAPIREAVDQMTSDDLEETQKKWDNFRDAVKDTSLSIGAALDVVAEEIKTTGANMKDALDKTIETNKALMKMGIEDHTGQVTKRTNEIATRLGRSPSDPEFQNEIKTNVAREVERGTLQLADMQARGELSIAERTGSGLENVAQQRVGLERETGGKMESAALGEGGERQNIITRAGQMRTGLAENEQNMKWQIGAGMVPTQISTGMGTTEFDQALINQRIQNAGAAVGGVTGAYGTMAGERYRQPTTTTHQPWSVADYIGTGLGVANLGMGMYSGITSAGNLRKAAGGVPGYNSSYNLGYGGNYEF